jgi:hypothetical protein
MARPETVAFWLLLPPLDHLPPVRGDGAGVVHEDNQVSCYATITSHATQAATELLTSNDTTATALLVHAPRLQCFPHSRGLAWLSPSRHQHRRD